MKKFVSLVCAAVMATPAFAQADGEKVLFQETETHISQPELRVFVNPMVCDLQMLFPNNPRREFSTELPLPRPIDQITQGEFENLQKRALYQFATSVQADVIVEPIFNSYVTAKDSKIMKFEVSGFPAKYVDFRPLGKAQIDLDMVKIVYPATYQNVVDSKQTK